MLSVLDAQMYSLADPDHYERIERLPDTTSRFQLDAAPPPPGWALDRPGLWTQLTPEGLRLPDQGWKIHVSAVPDEAAETLDRVARIALSHRVAFKFLRSGWALNLANGKYANRGTSGKFITVYPGDDDVLAALLGELVPALNGRHGPHILNDLRIGAGPVHVRYGAFVELRCLAGDGRSVPALRTPDGVLVPDERAPAFRLPPWVRPPAVLAAHLAARAAVGPLELPYRILRPLHFTNAGGTYLAQHRETGEKVVLREARPCSGLDGSGTDAVTRLDNEYDALTRLAGLDCVPRVIGRVQAWEHEYLIEEYVEGQTLLMASVYRTPLGLREPSATALTAYAQWVDLIVGKLERALDALHSRGVAFGDLHPGNVIVGAGNTVTLIDFEYAGGAGQPRAGAQGFTAPPDTDRFAADRFALRRLRLMLLVPLVELIDTDPGKEEMFKTLARGYFERTADAPRDTVFENWPTLRDALAAGILRAATPERDDRLFPGGPEVFDGQAAALGHGAAGVLLALHRAGVTVAAEQVDWLESHAVVGRPRHGLLDGLAGIAVSLAELGRPHAAAALLLERCRAAVPDQEPGLATGRVGIALALLDAGTDGVEAALREGHALRDVRTPEAGLFKGSAGIALLHLRLFRLTGDYAWLRVARSALGRDVERCVTMPDGTVQNRVGSRNMVYLDRGSGGIALVAREYLRHQRDPELTAFVEAVRRGCRPQFVREPGLVQGRAGIAALLPELGGPGAAAAAREQVRWLAVHAVRRGEALLIPGARLRRFSADLATGSAGVLAAAQRVLAGGPFPIPALLG